MTFNEIIYYANYGGETLILIREQHQNHLLKFIKSCPFIYVFFIHLEGFVYVCVWFFSGRDSHLTWETRVRILRDCSYALKYLHHHIEGCVVHRDIKVRTYKQWKFGSVVVYYALENNMHANICIIFSVSIMVMPLTDFNF